MSQSDAPHADRRFIAHELLTLCLRLCMEPTDSHSPDTMAVLDRWRKAWEEAAGGMDYDQALALVPAYALSATGTLQDAMTRIKDALKVADESRYQELGACDKEAAKWKAEDDMYGWNFHMGRHSGMNEIMHCYYRVLREVEAIEKESSATSDSTNDREGKDG